MRRAAPPEGGCSLSRRTGRPSPVTLDRQHTPTRSEASVRRRWFRVVAAVAARSSRCAAALSRLRTAQPGALVYPGMEIHQDTKVCTLGYVDPQTRIAFTAGHCRASGLVRDTVNSIGTQGSFRDNTPDGMTVDTNHQITDWEVIRLAPEVAINNVLPGGKALVTDPGGRAASRACRSATSGWSPARAAARSRR